MSSPPSSCSSQAHKVLELQPPLNTQPPQFRPRYSEEETSPLTPENQPDYYTQHNHRPFISKWLCRGWDTLSEMTLVCCIYTLQYLFCTTRKRAFGSVMLLIVCAFIVNHRSIFPLLALSPSSSSPSANVNSVNSSKKTKGKGISSKLYQSIKLKFFTSPYKTAHEESYSLFHDVHYKHWNKLKSSFHQIIQSSLLSTYGNDPMQYASPAEYYQQNWPVNFACPMEGQLSGMASSKSICYPHRILEAAVERQRKEEEELKKQRKKGGALNLLHKKQNEKEKAAPSCIIYSSTGRSGDYSMEMELFNLIMNHGANNGIDGGGVDGGVGGGNVRRRYLQAQNNAFAGNNTKLTQPNSDGTKTVDISTQNKNAPENPPQQQQLAQPQTNEVKPEEQPQKETPVAQPQKQPSDPAVKTVPQQQQPPVELPEQPVQPNNLETPAVPQQPLQPQTPIQPEAQIPPLNPQPEQIQPNGAQVPPGAAPVPPQTEVPATPAQPQLPPSQQPSTTETCEIHIFDPKYSPSTHPPPPLPNIIIHPWGFKGSNIPYMPNPNNYEFKSIQETLQLLNHEHRMIDLFVLDCNLCEWDVYRDLFASTSEEGNDNDERMDVQMEQKKKGLGLHLPSFHSKNQQSQNPLQEQQQQQLKTTSTFLQVLLKLHDTTPVTNDLFFQMEQHGYVTFHKQISVEQGMVNGMMSNMENGNHYDYSFLKLAPSFFEG